MVAKIETPTQKRGVFKWILLAVLSAILAVVVFSMVDFNSQVDDLAVEACAVLDAGATPEMVRSLYGDDAEGRALYLQVSAAVIEHCPDLAFG